MFSKGSRRWISRAIVTPSLVTSGEPVIFSRMTLRPLGPRVDLTASASWSTPAWSSAGLLPNFSSLATTDLLIDERWSRRARVRLIKQTRPGSRRSARTDPYRGLLLVISGGSMSPMNSAASSRFPNMTVRSSMWIILP